MELTTRGAGRPGVTACAAPPPPAVVLVAVSLATAVPPAAAPLGAQDAPTEWSVVSAELEADVSATDGSARVRLRYELSGTPLGAPLPLDRLIDFELLGFGEARVDDVMVRMTGSDEEHRVVLRPASGSLETAVVRPPAEVGARTLRLDVSYRVVSAVVGTSDLRGRVPVLTGPPVLVDPAGPGFRARLEVPREWALTEAFPSRLRRSEDGVYEVTLAVVPAVVGFRARADGTWRPGVPLLVDALALALLGAFAAFGWRHLRRVAA